jgi:hypothetical protein
MKGLDADDIGELGESKFRSICASARLICNKSERDRAGWDFIVQFPVTENSPGTLEVRAAPPTCYFQVKTTKTDKNSVSSRLTSLERLAKEPIPTFIYILKLDAKDEPVSAHLIHLLDEPLAEILKRLRLEDIEGKGVANRKKLSLSITKHGVRLPPTGEALREALESVFRENGPGYTAKKLDQLANIGFEERRHRGQFRVQMHPREFVDVLLGLKSDVPVTGFSVSEVRFGVAKASFPPLSEGLLTIRPEPIDSCTVSIRGVAGVPDSVLRGKVFVPPVRDIPSEYLKTVIDMGALKLIVGNAGVELSITDFKSPVTPTVWMTYWRFLWALQTGRAVVEIILDKVKEHPMKIPIDGHFPDLTEAECRHWAELNGMAAEVLRYVGATEPRVLLAEIHRYRYGIGAVFFLSRNLLPEINFSADASLESRDHIAGPVDLVYVDNFQIGDVFIAFYGVCTLKFRQVEDKTQAYADDVVLKRAIYLINPASDYEQFVAEAKQETGRDHIWARPLPESPLL